MQVTAVLRVTTQIAAALLLALIGSLPVAGQSRVSKVSPEFRAIASDQDVDVIVQWKKGVHKASHDPIAMRANWRREFRALNAAAARIKASELEMLASDPDVESIQPDRVVHAAVFIGTVDYGWMTALTAASKSTVLPYDGTGIGVAIIDSGIDDDEDLKDAKGHNRIVYKESFVTGDRATGDGYGHGNHVAGIVAGNGKHSSTAEADYRIRGIASNANVINLRVLDKNGAGRDSDVIAAISRAIALKKTYNIRVINLSLGRAISVGCTSDPLCKAVEAAWQAGIVVVVAAGNEGRDNTLGNDGYGTITAPGNSPAVITVGAMNTLGTLTRADDKITSYSSKGPTAIDHIAKPDLVAPGNRILSLRDSGSVLDQIHPENRVPKYVYTIKADNTAPDYYQLSGTSMAAPMVSGAAALLIQQNPAITPDQVKSRLMLTASKFALSISTAVDPTSGIAYTSRYDAFTVGAGYLDVQAALANTDLSDLPARSPQAIYDPETGVVFLADDPNTLWDTRSRWGLSVVWGTNTLSATRSVWRLATTSAEAWGVAVLGTGLPWVAPASSGFTTIWSETARAASGQAAAESLKVALDGEN